MINLMQIRSIAASVVKVQKKRLSSAEEVTVAEVDEMYMVIMDIFARKEETLKELSVGR